MSVTTKKVRATYVGRRSTTNGRLAWFWKIDGREDTAGYAKQIAPAKIGEEWELTFQGESVVVRGEGKPASVGFCKSKTDVTIWTAKEVVALQEHDERLAERKLAARKSQFETVIEPLRLMALSLRTHSERAAFIARVSSELWKQK